MREAEGEAARFNQIYAEYRPRAGRDPRAALHRDHGARAARVQQGGGRRQGRQRADHPAARRLPAARPAAAAPPQAAPQPPQPQRSAPDEPPRLIVWGVAALALLILLANTFFVVGQREQALVLRLGEPVRVVNAGRPRTTPG